MLTPTAPASALMAAPVGGAPRPWRSPGRLQVYGLVMTGAFACYILGHGLRGAGGATATVLSMVGAGACGWAWLIARALFDPAKTDAWWPRVVVFVVAISGALSVLDFPGGRMVDGVVGNTYALSGSAALLLTFFEPFHRYRRDLPVREKAFRFVFTGVYALLVAVSILSPGASETTALEAGRIALIESLCAVGGLITGAAAIGFRLRHPLALTGPSRPVRRAPTAADEHLARRVLHLLQHEDIHAEPDLKVADVAIRLGQPEYRVSQCVTAVLGFDNFNRMINHHRIGRARGLLVDPDERRSILEIAFDCGFGSLGPFNRAFKAETGMTPRAYRAVHRRADCAVDAADL